MCLQHNISKKCFLAHPNPQLIHCFVVTPLETEQKTIDVL